MRTSGDYRGEEVEVNFTADVVRCDLGVPGSPVWYEPENIEIDALTILGVNTDPKTLPSDLVNAIHALADEIKFEGC